MPQFNLRGDSIPAGYSNPAQHVDNFTNDGDEDEDMHEDNGIQELEYFCLVLSSQALLIQPSPVTVIYLHLPLLLIVNGPTLPTRSTLRYIKLRSSTRARDVPRPRIMMT
jgi:hypothetical protein